MVCLFKPGQQRRKRATAAVSISTGSSPKVCSPSTAFSLGGGGGGGGGGRSGMTPRQCIASILLMVLMSIILCDVCQQLGALNR